MSAEKKTTVVNVRAGVGYDVYIGRSGEEFHFGNPFSHQSSKFDVVKVNSREDAVRAFRDWIFREKWHRIHPKRREWIRNQVLAGRLFGVRLGCFCEPLPCHGRILAAMANRPEMWTT